MNHFDKLKQQVSRYIFTTLLLVNLSLVGVYLGLSFVIENQLITAGILGVIALVLASLFAQPMTGRVLQPVEYLWRAILHVSPEHSDTPAPDTNNARYGRELLTSLTLQIYQFASQQDSKSLVEHRKAISQAANIVNHLPLPLFVFNKEQLVTNASSSALEYCAIESSDLFGKPIFDNLNLEFPSELTLENWILECQDNKATDVATWERVRVILKDQKTVKQCDMAAYYNRDNPSGTEFIVTLFDRTNRYDQDDQALSFVALAVHELRTPLTMLRGYIEVFEDELEGKLDDEMKSFMSKMQFSAQQLSAFINNILNVARVEDNQLTLKLTEEKWEDVLKHTCEDMMLRTQIHGKNLKCEIAPGLPTVAIDRVSIYEVMANLVDNAIKYSGDSTDIIIKSELGKDGFILTTIQDFGIGIPEAIMPNLFEKFYRNHRTRSSVSGTGLGLYLSKAIVQAHGGTITAKSKEGEGSTFGFTLQPYAQLADELKTGNNDIIRGAHGWIKNHSYYRR